MSADPKPWLRCRCVHRWAPEGSDHRESSTPADPYYDRCRNAPLGEDGLCGHCRQVGDCMECPAERDACCLHSSQIRTVVDLSEPCMAVAVTAPF